MSVSGTSLRLEGTSPDSDDCSDASTLSCSPPDFVDPLMRQYESPRREPEVLIHEVFHHYRMKPMIVQFTDNCTPELKAALVKRDPKTLFELPEQHFVMLKNRELTDAIFFNTFGKKLELIEKAGAEYSLNTFFKIALFRFFHGREYNRLKGKPFPGTPEFLSHKLYLDFRSYHILPTNPDLTISRLAEDLIERALPPSRALAISTLRVLSSSFEARQSNLSSSKRA